MSLSLSSWLDNGRRLRPRLRLTPREAGASITRPLRLRAQAATSSVPPTLPSATETPMPRITLASQPVEPATMPPLVPIVPMADEQGDDLSNLERLDSETRRLIFLRHLVRRRVFNEGFSDTDLPRQYHRSHGLEASPPQE